MSVFDKQPTIKKRSGFSDDYLPKNKREALILAKGWLVQARDTTRIVNTTENPKVFFSRYDFLLDLWERLTYCERFVRFSGTLPSKAFNEANALRYEQTKKFIDRYARVTRIKIKSLSTSKGKQNKVETFLNTLLEYGAESDDKCKQYMRQTYEHLKQIACTEKE